LRVIGLDYGTKTVGVALSDETGLIAQPFETITRKHAAKLRKTYARIEELISEYDVSTIVLGLPKNMNNTEGERADDTRSFMADLERRTGLPVILVDERLTTVEAERILDAGGVRRSSQKEYVDNMAAAIILQNYLDRQNMSKPE
jgi:putative Holliday junction resolvase